MATNTAAHDTAVANTSAMTAGLATCHIADNVDNAARGQAPASETSLPSDSSSLGVSQHANLLVSTRKCKNVVDGQDPDLPLKGSNWKHHASLYPYIYRTKETRQNPSLVLEFIENDFREDHDKASYNVSFATGNVGSGTVSVGSDQRDSPRLFAKSYSVDDKTRFYEYTCIKHSFENEIRLYADQLRELQGSVVPRCYGGWQSDDGTFITVLDHVGEPPSKERRTDPSFQQQVRQAVMAIVRAGVCRDDLRWRHVLCHGNEVRIVGFGEADLYGRWDTKESWEARGESSVNDLFEYIDDDERYDYM